MNRWQVLQGALGNGATVLTGNARAARRLQLDYAREQANLGHQAWSTPNIFEWQTWLRQLWQEWVFWNPDAPLLLTPMQERALWQRVQHSDAGLVVSPESMAVLAQGAYSLLSSYQAHESRNHYWQEVDAERFRQWAERFDRACDRNHWVSASLLEERMAKATPFASLQLPRELVLVGFDRMTALQQSLLHALDQHGVRLTRLDALDSGVEPHLEVHIGERDEIAACACWARRLLEADPRQKIAVLSTEIERQRGEIDRTFRAVLTPESSSILGTHNPRTVYEFSLGDPLSTVPVIHAALLAMRWVVSPLPQHEATWLLLSGFLCNEQADRLALSRLDARLRERAELSPLLSLPHLLSNMSSANSLAAVRHRLRRAHDFAAQHGLAHETRSPSAWSELTRLLLDQFGWPFADLDSVQYQARQRWDRLLDDFSALDLQSESIGYARFLHDLSMHAEETLFSAESLDAPIQIMGPMESAGQHFDAIWFLGLTDQQWPSSGTVHPLLTLQVQRAAAMPHAAKDDDWQLAHSVTQRILNSAPQVVFSWSQRNQDGELRPSPLLAPFQLAAEHPAESRLPSAPVIALESFYDDTQVVWRGGESTGGAGLLRDQAACPFRSFAAHRLHARALEEPEWGLSAIERGNLLHDVLQRLWTEEEPLHIASLADLRRSIDNHQLLPVLHHHIGQTFAEWMQRYAHDAWSSAYLRSEQQRLATRLLEWLRCEAQRQPFEVEACEQQLTDVQVGNLHLRLRADRIDRLPDGSRLLIDYKTGAVSPSAWHGDRPDEPQLPLYAAYGNVEEVAGVLFAQIRAGNTGFSGHVRDAKTQMFAELKSSEALVKAPYLDEMRDAWTQALAALAEEFARGEAVVRPKHGKRTCEHCELKGLCRIQELLSIENSEGENDHA